MKNSFFLIVWFLFFSAISYEYYQLNLHTQNSILQQMQNKNLINKNFNLSPDPGRPLSLYLGYIGFAVMLLTNLYIFRKRFKSLHNWGKISNWLNFHIFCGLLGPTCILFHSNFKVRGLVAISFWSMMVSVTSGVIGRYFYVQISKIKGDFIREAEKINTSMKKYIEKLKIPVSDEILIKYKNQALAMAGATTGSSNPLSALWNSMLGDLHLLIASPPAPKEMGEVGKFLLKEYAINIRKANTVDSFNKLMGYWHTFHMPFAIFMYLAAIFHIAAALLLGV